VAASLTWIGSLASTQVVGKLMGVSCATAGWSALLGLSGVAAASVVSAQASRTLATARRTRPRDQNKMFPGRILSLPLCLSHSKVVAFRPSKSTVASPTRACAAGWSPLFVPHALHAAILTIIQDQRSVWKQLYLTQSPQYACTLCGTSPDCTKLNASHSSTTSHYVTLPVVGARLLKCFRCCEHPPEHGANK
jgi:hypothetical protein